MPSAPRKFAQHRAHADDRRRFGAPVDLPSLADPILPDRTWTPTVTIDGEDQEIIAAVGQAVLALFD
ncbi:hypothetical protein [Nocardia xishanensis]|uniref:hypothetical protein n=1 Tax=Nocardia xishanensis TaxID=238964 RepID=UPI0012F4983B|nr:hypothetical protein [Nocardia xishanensis]